MTEPAIVPEKAILQVDDLHSYYGDSHIIQGLNLQVNKGEIAALLGRNGVGKSTFFKTVIGILPVGGGDISFDGVSLKGLKQYRIARRGIAYVPQGREVFADLTVRDNLLMGGMVSHKKQISEEIFEFFPVLEKRLSQKAGTLSGGEQQMLAIGRALSGDPKLLLLDEPTEGIQPSIVDAIADIIIRINKELGLSIIVIEQNLDFAFSMAHRCYIMEKGRIVSEGLVEEIRGEVAERHLAI